ncbi:hypothetical protein VTK56DRAFT_3850 [Thermocarpiscus australiensis]
MVPVNGVAGKPAKTVTRRATSKTVVPVLPLNYPQRPTNKQTSAPTVTSSRTHPRVDHQTVEKSGSHLPPQPQESTRVGNSTNPDPNSANDPGASTPSAVRAPIPAQAESSESVTTPDGRGTDTPTVSSALPDRRMESPTNTRSPDGANPASDALSSSGPIPEGPIPGLHPAIMSRPAFHQAHPSTGSLVLGNFQDSNASSPAPRSGGSGFPPPGVLPYPPAAAVDGYGRPLLISPAADGYPSTLVSHHGPPTPHSFHGSQSSVHAEEHGFNQYPSRNGHSGFPTDPARQASVPPSGINPAMHSAIHAAAGSIPAYQSLRDQDEALSFLRHGISDNTFNDCVLEVHFPDSPEFQDHPGHRQLHNVLRIPGHRFILSRSPTLVEVMKAQGTVPGGVLFLEVHDEYMRPDVFWFSLRTLYGWSLADGILPTELRLRDARDDLKTALSYIATARYLRLGWVHSVAVQRASRLLFWNTIELAVKFVSKSAVTGSRNDRFNLSELLDQVLAFIVQNFPVDFVLDNNAGDFGFPRLPPASAPPRNPNAPTIAHGTSGGPHSRQASRTQAQMPRNSRMSSNLRLSQIRFGDISPSKYGNGPDGPLEKTQPSRIPTPNDTILSRILLNLPFELLKQILEHPHLAKSSGELSPSSRQKIIVDIINERESRRLRALEKGDPQLRVYQERVESAAAPLVVGHIDDFWVNNLGFKEEVFPGDLPYLVHTWIQGGPAGAGA